MHKTKNHGRQFYRLHFGADWAKFEGIDKEHITTALKDEEIKHDTVITPDQLDLLEKYGIKLASIFMNMFSTPDSNSWRNTMNIVSKKTE